MSYIHSGGGSGSLTKATGNLTWWVATTGSDSNPGTLAAPFATIQHAVNVAAQFDYGLVFQPTINVEDGTYNVPARINLPGITGLNATTFAFLTGNTTTPTNVVLNDTSGTGFSAKGIFQQLGPFAVWVVNGFELFTDGVGFYVASNAALYYGNLTFAGPGGGSAFFFNAYALGQVSAFSAGHTITITNISIGSFTESALNSFVQVINTTVNFPVALTVTSDFIYAFGHATFEFDTNTVVNFAGVSGPQFALNYGTYVITNNGLLSDIPGTLGSASNFFDETSALISITTGRTSIFGQSFAGIPTAAILATGCWGVYKDSSGGGVYVAYNDAGTIKKVALV